MEQAHEDAVAMIGRTLGAYLSKRFLRAVIGVFAVLFGLVFVLDFVETLRRASDVEGVNAASLAILSLLRVPAILEQTLPFVVLFGAMGSFLAMSRRLELVVARASGVSAWQFLAPAIFLAGVIGLFAAMVFNPLSAGLKAEADAREAQIFGKDSQSTSREGRWIRQRSVDGQAVIRAASSENQGLILNNVTVFAFDSDGRFKERIEAQKARLEEGLWRLSKVRVLVPDEQPTSHDTYTLATNLTAAQVQQSFASSDTVSFWRLPSAIDLAQAAGLDANEYRLQYQTLLARPALLIAMVLIAAMVSLRFARFGGIGYLIVGGVGAGFVLYVATKMAEDLGTAGLVNAAAAAWSPAVVGMLIGVTVLLNQEDG
jgi:lipopolysaccharide export system permease protein